MRNIIQAFTQCLILGIIVSSSVVSADEFGTSLRQIEKIRFYSAERPTHVGYQGIAIVHLSPGTITYGNLAGCNSSQFSVLNSDKSLISSMIAARVAEIGVIISVENSSTFGNGTFCRIVKVEM